MKIKALISIASIIGITTSSFGEEKPYQLEDVIDIIGNEVRSVDCDKENYALHYSASALASIIANVEGSNSLSTVLESFVIAFRQGVHKEIIDRGAHVDSQKADRMYEILDSIQDQYKELAVIMGKENLDEGDLLADLTGAHLEASLTSLRELKYYYGPENKLSVIDISKFMNKDPIATCVALAGTPPHMLSSKFVFAAIIENNNIQFNTSYNTNNYQTSVQFEDGSFCKFKNDEEDTDTFNIVTAGRTQKQSFNNAIFNMQDKWIQIGTNSVQFPNIQNVK